MPRAPLGSTVPGSKNAAVECREARRSNRRRRLARPWLAPSGAPPLLARSGGTDDLGTSPAPSGARKRTLIPPEIRDMTDPDRAAAMRAALAGIPPLPTDGQVIRE